MSNFSHANQTKVHRPYNWIVPDATARNAITPTATDQYKEALQLDNGSIWTLMNHSPITWQQTGGSAAGDASTTTKGVSKLSVAPTSATDPIAAGTNDPRLSDARTPTAHAASHASGGADALSGNLNATARVAVKKAGTVIGTRRGVNLIEGANVTLTVADDATNEEVDVTIAAASGGGSTLAHPDAPPASPHAANDEFESTTLAAKWTATSTAAAFDIHTTYPSHVFVKFTGNQNFELDQAFAPGADFQLTMKARVSPQSNFQAASINAIVDANNFITVTYQFDGGGPHFDLQGTSGGTFSRQGRLTIGFDNTVFLHMQRVADVYHAWGSFDGFSWYKINATRSQAGATSAIRFRLGQGGSGIPMRAAIDWVRVNWINLL